MKILDVAHIREWDAQTIKNEPIQSIDLMERAARACADWLLKKYEVKRSFHIFCGNGNNGGDGMAIARMLLEAGYQVKVYAISTGNKPSADFETNLKRLKEIKNASLKEVTSIKDVPAAELKNAVVVDALFGSGLSKPLDGLNGEVVKLLNDSAAGIVAVDVPSGLGCDSLDFVLQSPPPPIVKARYTLTFQSPKFTFFFPEANVYVGEFVVLPIGLNDEYTATAPSTYQYVTKEFARSVFMPRRKFDHKGVFGHALMFCGSYGKMGAALMASRACLRSGAGLLTIYTPGCGYDILQSGIPEAMIVADADEHYINRVPPEIDKYNAIGAGPGIGNTDTTAYALKQMIKACKQPMVLDADALNIMADEGNKKGMYPQHTVLTPHVKEFERLAGKVANSMQRHERQLAYAKQHQVFVVLKGANTGIACPDGSFYFNSTGNPGMAKGGSGDVLTGVITGLMARGYEAKEAAILGVYIHGAAGDLAARDLGLEGMLATDIIERLGLAAQELE
jgi:hydroxyethylthiazole kinase-like uncharacterized protein yjeF